MIRYGVNNTNYYCTLFDSGYFSRGLLLHKSLMENSPGSFLYIFAFDDLSFVELSKMNLKNTKIISLHEFEDEKLLAIKPTRSKGEYCWTCTPSVIKYCLDNFSLPQCTYLDADLYFFSDPTPLLQEMKESSVLITDHRYTKKYDQTLTSGRYCVQFMSFKNTGEGKAVLNWWRDRCIEWCYSRIEDGKFGDQKYLDSWTTQFKGVHELVHLGGGVAPWNFQQYSFSGKNPIVLTEKDTGSTYPLVFFHFHALKVHKDYFDLGNYELHQDAKKLVYMPYVKALTEIDKELSDRKLEFNWHAMATKDKSLKGFLRFLKRKLLGIYNVVPSEGKLHG